MTFDPTGTRLAIWIADASDPTVGTLQLIVLDPMSGNIESSLTPRPGGPAMRGFSIELGRLAWVSPSGQDGAESSVPQEFRASPVPHDGSVALRCVHGPATGAGEPPSG